MSAPIATPAPLPRLRRLCGEAAVTVVVTLLVVAAHLRLWKAPWRAPWSVDGDASFYLMLVQGLARHGTYLTNPDLGWPAGQTLYDLPHGTDNLHFVVLRVLAAVTPTPAMAINLFYLLTFAGVAFVAHLVLRRFGIGAWASGVGAFAYAIAPYHFIRGETHLLLSGYELLPVGVLFALTLLRDPLPFFTDAPEGERGRLDLRNRRTWWIVAGCVGLASTGAYYFVFAMMLVALAGLARAIGTWRWRPLVAAGLMVAIGAVAFLVNVSPTLVYEARHGANTAVAARRPGETYLYGLKISQLFIPRQGHRIDKLAGFSDRSQGRGPLAPFESESGQQLGLMGAAGLALALAALAARLAAGEGRRRWLARHDARAAGDLGLFGVVCMIVASMGGLSYIVSSVGLREIRSWNRISIVLAFLGVAVAAFVLDRVMGLLHERLPAGGPAARVVPVALALVVGGVAFLDQAGRDAPDYAAVKAREASLGTFFGSVRTALGDGASVFQLPNNGFPETPARQRMGSYDQAVGFVYAPELRWSWGAMRGRSPAYIDALAQQPTDEWLTSVAAIGFTGVTVDRFGYTDTERTAVEADLNRLLGPPKAVSADDRYLFFDLRAYADAVRGRLGQAGTTQRAAQALALEPTTPPAG